MVSLLCALLFQVQDPVTVKSAAADKTDVKAGDVVKVTVKLEVVPGKHIYSVTWKDSPTVFKLADGVSAKIDGAVGEPKPKIYHEEKLKEDYPVHEGEVEFVVPVRLDDAAKGDVELKGNATGQACDERNCTLFDVAWSVKVKVAPASGPIRPQRKPPPKVEITSSKADKNEAKVGEIVKVTIEMSISDTYHIYPTTHEISPTTFEFDGPFEMRGKVEEQPNAKFRNEPVFEKTAKFVVPVLVKEGAKPGPLDFKMTVKFQACDDKNCFPQDKSATLRLKILEGKVEPPPLDPKPGSEDPLSKGLLAFLGFCVVGGLVSLVMPCVYPLLPITLTFFVKQSEGSRAKSFFLAAMYGLGIIVTFTGLGFLLSIALGKSGAQIFSSNPWVNIGIAGLFFVLALSLFGLFELRLPSFLTNKLAGGAPKQGAIGAFGLGLIFAVVTFTCTIPIAATLLAMAASGKAAWALFGMLVYSGTMAVPFLIMGFFPDLLKKMPKSGGWLHTVKICAAFLELALAMKYFANAHFSFGWNFLSRDMVLALWVICSFFTATYLLDFWRFQEDEKKEHIGFGRMFWALGFGTLGFFLIAGLAGRHLGGFEVVLPLDESITAGGGGGKEAKQKEFGSLEEGVAEAKKESKPVFLEFTGFS